MNKSDDDSDDCFTAEGNKGSTSGATLSKSSEYARPFLQLFYFILIWQMAFKVSNAAVVSLIRFLKFFLKSVATAFKCQMLHDISNNIPITRQSVQKFLGSHCHSTTQYIVCPKCDAIYHPDMCKSVSEGKFKATFCSYKPFPTHPHARKRNPCGAALMTAVKINSRSRSTTVFRPVKVYPYNSLTIAIMELVKKPSFLHNCEAWRRRSNFRDFGYFCDLYDGDV